MALVATLCHRVVGFRVYLSFVGSETHPPTCHGNDATKNNNVSLLSCGHEFSRPIVTALT